MTNQAKNAHLIALMVSKKKTPRFLPSCDSSKQPAKVSKNKKQEQTPS
jgi:hypothetical protein